MFLTQSQSIAMERTSRTIDIIVYGATGFTGAFVSKYIQSLSIKGVWRGRWAIAGRSQSKLDALLNELKIESSTSLPEVFVADASSHNDLVSAFKKGKLLLNCTGPYRFLGEQIVKACLDASIDYMDICGEPQFMEKMFLDYNDEAEKNETLIINSCAFDSVPADLGCLFTERLFSPGRCSSVESFLQLNCGPDGLGGHYTTFECAVHGISDAQTLRTIRRDINTKYRPPEVQSVGPRLNKVSSYFWDDRMQTYAIPFMGADSSVVRSSVRSRSIRERNNASQSQEKAGSNNDLSLKRPQYAAYMCVGGLRNLALTSVFGLAVSTLANWSWGRSFLLAYPGVSTFGVFSHEGPSEKQLETTSFEMHFYAKGYSDKVALPEVESVAKDVPPIDKEVHVIVSGPEPGYVATPIIFVTLAIALLEERATALPKGGVLTPASAFYDSRTAVDRLIAAGISFKVV